MREFEYSGKMPGTEKLETEPFSQSCPIEGYKAYDSKAKRYYFWNSEYGLLAVIEDDKQHSVLFKVKERLPENLDDLLKMTKSGRFLKNGCSSELFETIDELEDFLNKYMCLLLGLLMDQQQYNIPLFRIVFFK